MSPPTAGSFHFVHPGSVRQMSGGTLYDLRVIEELRRNGWRVDLHELPGRFPVADRATAAAAAAAALLDALPDGATAAFDGLALPAFDGTLVQHAERLVLLALVHHPTADETGLPDSERRHLFGVEKRLFAVLRRIVVPSPSMARRLADFDVTADRIDVAEPGVARAPRATGSGSDSAALLCVASLTPRKGHVALLEALAGCLDLDWRLDCVGPTENDPATTDAVKAAIERFGLSNRVRLAGPRVGHDLDALYAAADVFVLASQYEGYGMAFAEAMMRGLPVVASGAGAVRDTVPDTAGVFVPVGDRVALTAGLRRMIADPAFRRTRAAGAWAAGRALPRWSDTAARFARAVAAAQSG